MWSKSNLSRAVNLLIRRFERKFQLSPRYESIRGGAALAARRLSNTDSEQTRNELFHSTDTVNYSLSRLAGSFGFLYFSNFVLQIYQLFFANNIFDPKLDQVKKHGLCILIKYLIKIKVNQKKEENSR